MRDILGVALAVGRGGKLKKSMGLYNFNPQQIKNVTKLSKKVIKKNKLTQINLILISNKRL
jgi:hypothetical protein